ncbi:TetR/AcrR family transcriptional regulator [Planococcus sp. CPCC 101016]|uniref:TetR/AcrR family transcriptional regulator n=1 Tax=Planococcus sp. CPCC 101016 TaxID=2599617 RepID=UPI0011B5E3BD|nr:TetR/AcrR family transcriptional regulator [Planococcus sp. CPCC 101016]TWT06409.1 TetR/AcrR family transcriptional regulator [Planococcus sp. CPCC 101016]
MPKLTFYNLSKEKQLHLIEAAKEEFSNASLSDASIANIVKAAGISRGSFYQYFEGKEDLYFHLLNSYTAERKEFFRKTLQKTDGDLFQAIRNFYISTVNEEELLDFKRNVLLNMTEQVETKFIKIVSEEESEEAFKTISKLIDVTKLNVSGNKELYHLLKILMSVTIRNWIEHFAKNLTIKESIANYELELRLLKKGLSHP